MAEEVWNKCTLNWIPGKRGKRLYRLPRFLLWHIQFWESDGPGVVMQVLLLL